MTIEKQEVVSSVEVSEQGVIRVEMSTRFVEDGAVIGNKYHSETFAPGADLSSQGDKVRAIAAAVWTPEVVQAWTDALAAREAARQSAAAKEQE